MAKPALQGEVIHQHDGWTVELLQDGSFVPGPFDPFTNRSQEFFLYPHGSDDALFYLRTDDDGIRELTALTPIYVFADSESKRLVVGVYDIHKLGLRIRSS